MDTAEIAGNLQVHTALGSGDMEPVSFFECNRDKQVVTIDDIENKVSYFYGRSVH